MSDLLVTATLPHVSNLPKDACTNTFAFHTTGDADQNDLDAIHDALIDFYTVVVPDINQSISSILGAGISRAANACVLKTYDITGKLGYIIDPVTGKKKVPNHGSPIDVSAFTLSSAGGLSLPEECSIVCTLRAEGWEDAAVEAPDNGDIGTESNRPRQRHSGRLFVGPIAQAFNENVDGKSRPNGTVRDTVDRAVQRLAQDVDAPIGNRYLAVWSRMDATLRRVTHVEVDNAWDTQRRRGPAPTVRSRRAVDA